MEDHSPRKRNRLLPLALIAALLLAGLWAAGGGIGSPPPVASEAPGDPSTAPSGASVAQPPPASPTPALGGELPVLRYEFPGGVIVLSMQDGRNAHLFLYHPEQLPLTRITQGDWDDIRPAVSPDGARVAFSSNRDGYWDLFILDMRTGAVEQITDTPAYEGAPSWSPDGLFLAFESLVADNLDLYIVPVDGGGDPIRLTVDPAADHSPAWSPGGRQIAFVSTRGGDPDVWLAELGDTDERFTNLSRSPGAAERHPAWSAGGDRLVWAANQGGLHNLIIWEAGGRVEVSPAGSGDWPVFSPDGETILTLLEAPNRSYLAAYPAGSPGLVTLPPLAVPGQIRGLAWGDLQIGKPLPEGMAAASVSTPAALWAASTQTAGAGEGLPGRGRLAPLGDVEAPDPRLLDDVDEAFNALRAFSAGRLGWDLLSTLENAFVSITAPLPPGLSNDWLQTGRAFALTRSPVSAGWIVLLREDFGTQTYWRVFVQARFQDGSQGRPLHELPFDLNARHTGDPAVYEQGGLFMEAVPGGYWVDFTALALTFGWERLPALLNWRTFYQGARFNEFVLTGGLSWEAAMLALYPPEAMITASPITPVTPTATPTRTPTPTITPTPTPTAAPSDTPMSTFAP